MFQIGSNSNKKHAKEINKSNFDATMLSTLTGDAGPRIDLPGSPGLRGEVGLPGNPGRDLFFYILEFYVFIFYTFGFRLLGLKGLLGSPGDQGGSGFDGVVGIKGIFGDPGIQGFPGKTLTFTS